MSKKTQRVERSVESQRRVKRLAAVVRREVQARLGPNSTFEQRRDAAVEVMSEVLWNDADGDLQGLVTDDEEVEVDGKRYRRLAQPSSATYYGRWGPHAVEERLYREVGVHNGRTIKPIELRVGIVEHMTPDMARVTGELSADDSSRAVEKILRVVGLVPPSRAFIADRVTAMAAAVADDVAKLEEAAREAETVPDQVASVSCGLDRMSVRMNEPANPDQAMEIPYRWNKLYLRTPPPPKEAHYRKPWVGSTTVYDVAGKALHTWRYGVEAEADPDKLAERVAADVAWILSAHPDLPLHCIQDAAPELRALPEALARILPESVKPIELIDYEHLMGYLDKVVDACEPEGDPWNMKLWYRDELVRDDDAIDRLWRSLRRKAKLLPGRQTKARKAVAAALSYIKKRKNKMRYASHYAANLPIGSGATESTCWQMQQRVKLPGQSWETRGLRATLAIRGLVLSDRWDTAWQPYAAMHRKEVRIA